MNDVNDSKNFIKDSDGMDDIYKNIEKYISNKKRKILTVFYDMIPDVLSLKKLNPIVELESQTFLLSLSYNPILLCQKY